MELLQQYPEWFQKVIQDADGELRTLFLHLQNPQIKENIYYVVAEDYEGGAPHAALVGRFEEHVKKWRR